MYPFRCKKCSKISHSPNITKPPTCCDGAELDPLAKICLLVPAGPNEPFVHQSTQGVLVDHTTKWKVACGATSLPEIHTPEPEACTCKECLAYATKLMDEINWVPSEPEIPDNTTIQVREESPETS
jgi:hypothetical protein